MARSRQVSDEQGKQNEKKPVEDLSNSVLYEVVEDHICKITLNRPERRNAIAVPDMSELLAKYLERAQDDDRVKVIVLGANGQDFCAGEDTRRSNPSASRKVRACRSPSVCARCARPTKRCNVA
jgi:enoyl-CoA hydratase/carnithine racemase